MKTVTKLLLLGLACASIVPTHAAFKAKDLLKNFFDKNHTICKLGDKKEWNSRWRKDVTYDRKFVLHPFGLVFSAVLTKVGTSLLIRQKDNSMLTVGKNALKSLGGSMLAATLLFAADTEHCGLVKTLQDQNVLGNGWLAEGKKTTGITVALKVAAGLAYLAGQNNWNPIKALTPKALKEFFTKKRSTSEQLEFLLNTLVPVWAAHEINKTLGSVEFLKSA